MRAIFFMPLLFTVSQIAFAHEDPTISTAKIAELSAHRADRLVALGKIDSAFVQKMEAIEVTRLASGPAAYKAILSQTQPKEGVPFQLELQFDHDGKPLSFRILPGGTAGPDMRWSPKIAGELVENGMHYILDNSSKENIAPYFNDFTKLVLVKGELKGKAVALVQITASSQEKALNVFVNLDGTLNSVVVGP